MSFASFIVDAVLSKEGTVSERLDHLQSILDKVNVEIEELRSAIKQRLVPPALKAQARMTCGSLYAHAQSLKVAIIDLMGQDAISLDKAES